MLTLYVDILMAIDQNCGSVILPERKPTKVIFVEVIGSTEVKLAC